ncbi:MULTISPECIES: HNH endonuclease [Chelativorans]|jgi:5-methylcytosine-specific restriction endonuclease McrA
MAKDALRTILRERQGRRCCYCGVSLTPPIVTTKKRKPLPTSETLEHLRRQSEGGTSRRDNLALACYQCNTGRGAMDWLTYTSYRRGELWELA